MQRKEQRNENVFKDINFVFINLQIDIFELLIIGPESFWVKLQQMSIWRILERKMGKMMYPTLN